MEIKDLLEKYKTNDKNTVQKSERAELVKKFVDRLNGDRLSSGFKALPASFYAVKMAQARLSTNDLYWFYRYCQEAKSFSKCWWWSLKPEEKNEKQTT